MLNLYNAATTDPRHADTATIDKYLSGKALTLTNDSLSGMAKTGYAYRGTPADPRLKVSSVVSPTFLFLTSCPLASSTDPYVEYSTATGKPVPVATRTPVPPYLLTIPMKKTSGQWQVTDLVQDTSKTCGG